MLSRFRADHETAHAYSGRLALSQLSSFCPLSRWSDWLDSEGEKRDVRRFYGTVHWIDTELCRCANPANSFHKRCGNMHEPRGLWAMKIKWLRTGVIFSVRTIKMALDITSLQRETIDRISHFDSFLRSLPQINAKFEKSWSMWRSREENACLSKFREFFGYYDPWEARRQFRTKPFLVVDWLPRSSRPWFCQKRFFPQSWLTVSPI